MTHNEKIFRPWGYYINIISDDSNYYKIKKLVLFPKKKQDLLIESISCKQLTVLNGTPRLLINDQYYLLQPTENIMINPNEKYKIENNTNKIIELLEINFYNYFDLSKNFI